MIREIIHDPIILKIKSAEATAEDVLTARDMAETLEHHREGCVGMAANMIGVNKRIIVFYGGRKMVTMFNPVITEQNQPYETAEGCLSLLGKHRPVTRYKSIKVKFQDKFMKLHEKRYSGYTAQIIQHEVDHCNGILI